MSGKEQANLLGLFFWIFSGLQLLVVGLILVLYLFVFGAVFATIPHKANEPDPTVMFPILVVVMAFVFVMLTLFTIPKIIAGYGLRNEKSWARGWAIAACCMAAMSFPLGTALGVWGLIFLLGEEGKRYFDNPAYGRMAANAGSAGIQPPPPNSWQQ